MDWEAPDADRGADTRKPPPQLDASSQLHREQAAGSGIADMQQKGADEQSWTMGHQYSSLQSLVLTLMSPGPNLAGRRHLATRAACMSCDGPDMMRADSGSMAWSLQPCTVYVV